MALSIGTLVGLGIYVALLGLAGLSDFWSLRIPNGLTASLAAAFVPVALVFGHHVDWLSHLGAGLAVFAGAAILFALGIMGGGDVKLLAAVAVWTGLRQLLPFLMLTMMIGGLFALVMLLLRAPTAQLAFLAALKRLPAFAEGKIRLPYGIPIAAAGILIAPSFSFLV